MPSWRCFRRSSRRFGSTRRHFRPCCASSGSRGATVFGRSRSRRTAAQRSPMDPKSCQVSRPSFGGASARARSSPTLDAAVGMAAREGTGGQAGAFARGESRLASGSADRALSRAFAWRYRSVVRARRRVGREPEGVLTHREVERGTDHLAVLVDVRAVAPARSRPRRYSATSLVVSSLAGRSPKADIIRPGARPDPRPCAWPGSASSQR